MNRFKRALPWALTIFAVLWSPLAAQQITRDNTTGAVVGLGSGLTPAAGQTTCSMDTSLADQVAAHQPNGGLVVHQFSPAPCTGTVVATPAAPTPTATPTSAPVAAGANAGTTPPSPGCVAGALCTNQRGALQFGTGASPTAGSMLVATFPGGGYSTPPAVTITPLNAATASLNLYLNVTTTTVTFKSVNAPSASQGASTYQFIYLVTP